jgi:putative membrane-bound dehydrogenase-like protein
MFLTMSAKPLLLLLLLCMHVRAAEPDTRLVRETGALTPEQEQVALHVPPGFEIRLFAAEPMIHKPINLAFDERGRLWVSSTVEYPYAAAKERWSDPQGTHVRDSRDAIKILEDADGDGRADKVVDFADGLNIPTGVLPWHKPEHKAGCIAWSIPNLWYFADTDGDDRADIRQVLFGPLGYEKDTHGMCSSFRLGTDGWVYATHGFNNTSRFPRSADGSDGSNAGATKSSAKSANVPDAKSGKPSTKSASSADNPGSKSASSADQPFLELHSGNVFRFLPDGSRVERWTHGQVNPFGLAWDERGNLYSADCHSSPVYQLIRGAHYPSFGKPHDGLGFAPVMCQHTHGSTGICGIAYVDGGVWGAEWNDHLFVGNVVTSRVNHDRVVFTGSTPKAVEQPDFITSDDPWFRPVDLRIGPDNALYIADFYNRIIGHYEVPLDHPGRDRERGRIWKVVKTSGTQARQKPVAPDISDPAAIVRTGSPQLVRAALAHLQEKPDLSAVPALLKRLKTTPPEDESLIHHLRVTLRDHLAMPGGFKDLPAAAELSGIALAVPSAEAAAYITGTLEDRPSTPAEAAHIARHAEPTLLAPFILRARRVAPGSVPTVTAIHDGLGERGLPAPPEFVEWAQTLAVERLDALKAAPAPAWTQAASTEPPAWTLRERPCADGVQARVLQSMNAGGGDEERRTGVLKSSPFTAPATLSLWINGHRGFPKAAPHDRNLVRIVEAGSGAVLARAFPPRSDICQSTRLDLSGHAGKRVRLEIVDGDDGSAYAWLGVTRIEPSVIHVEDFQTESGAREELRSLALILQHSAPAGLRERLAAHLPPRPAPPPLPVSPEQRGQLDRLISDRVKAYRARKPDIARGRQTFQASCAVCHRIGGQGGLIGPQLDGIGARGAERLTEDILDPNRNVDAHFHLHSFTMKDGGTLAGFLKAEAGQVSILADAAGQEHRISKRDVEKSTVTPVSLMPPTFGQMLDEAVFADLLGYLLEERASR